MFLVLKRIFLEPKAFLYTNSINVIGNELYSESTILSWPNVLKNPENWYSQRTESRSLYGM